MSYYHTEQRFSIYPTYIISTPIFTGGNGIRSKAQRDNEKNLTDNSAKGQLSKKASTKLNNAVNWLVSSAQYKRVYSKQEQKHFYFKINFITLTIPEQPTDQVNGKVVSEMLHTWITYARKYFYLRNYVWKIEAGKKGLLHIHLTTDTFIHYKRVRDSWNKIMQKRNLIDHYYNRTGHYNPNSTDIHSVKNVRNIGGYICKYMSKESGLPDSFRNRIWGCSVNLSHENKCCHLADQGSIGQVVKPLMNRNIRWKRLESKPDRMGMVKSVGEIFFVNERVWKDYITGAIKEAYDTHRFYIRSCAIKPPKEYFEIEYIKEPVKIIEPCKIEKPTQKIGQTQYDLQF